jgi:flagellar motor component MotA
MPKYKNLTPELVEGFLDKFFSKIATKAADRAVSKIQKNDPKLANLLKTAQKLRKDGEKFLNSMSSTEREKYEDDFMKRYGG